LGDILDNFEQRQIIELIDNRIKTWWESAEQSYKIGNIQISPKKYLITATEYLNNQINIINPKVDSILSESKNRELQYQNNLKNLSVKISEIQIKFNALMNENKKLYEEIEQLKRKISQQEIKPNAPLIASIENNKKSVVSIPSDNIIKLFNGWASDLKTNLPSQFFYAEGELRLREKQNITRTDNNKSLWIINKTGTIKYLFPNPNAIDEIGGNIDTVYTVTGTRKAKGQNRVNVLKACEINDDGWIEYKGELNLL